MKILARRQLRIDRLVRCGTRFLTFYSQRRSLQARRQRIADVNDVWILMALRPCQHGTLTA